MKRQKEINELITTLKKSGFVPVREYEQLYINKSGEVWNISKGKQLKRDQKNKIYFNKRFSVPKLLLLTFKNEPIREKQHIRYKDGNSLNISLENVEYIRELKSELKTLLNGSKLYTAIRCYFEVSPKYKIKDWVLTQMYIQSIAKKRLFIERHTDIKYIDIFKNYIEGFQMSIKQTATATSKNMFDVSMIVNEILNTFSDEILTDLKAGKLSVKEFEPKKPNKTDVRKRVENYINTKLK